MVKEKYIVEINRNDSTSLKIAELKLSCHIANELARLNANLEVFMEKAESGAFG